MLASTQNAIRRKLETPRLDEWEVKFLTDILAKSQRYGVRTRLSPKQYSVLARLIGHNRTRPNLKLIQGRRKRSRRGRRSRLLNGFFGAALLSTGLAFLSATWLPERFPEYTGPLVEYTADRTITAPVSHVRDGDTIEVGGVPVRLGSLDCAESGTEKGEAATRRMYRLVASQTLTCYLNGRTSYDRKIGSCQLASGTDVGSVMIREGYCSRYMRSPKRRRSHSFN